MKKEDGIHNRTYYCIFLIIIIISLIYMLFLYQQGEQPQYKQPPSSPSSSVSSEIVCCQFGSIRTNLNCEDLPSSTCTAKDDYFNHIEREKCSDIPACDIGCCESGNLKNGCKEQITRFDCWLSKKGAFLKDSVCIAKDNRLRCKLDPTPIPTQTPVRVCIVIYKFDDSQNLLPLNCDDPTTWNNHWLHAGPQNPTRCNNVNDCVNLKKPSLEAKDSKWCCLDPKPLGYRISI